MKQPAVYIVTSKRHGVLYTGVTSNLIQRIYTHKNGLLEGFSKKYNCTKLVFYELHETMYSAISREKQIQAGSRKRKIELIEGANPEWLDLFDSINV